MRTNWVGLIDEWATRFFHELDYEREAQNGMTFKEQMAGLEGIVVADVYQDLSNKEVLTTVWMEGMQSTIEQTLFVQLAMKQSRIHVCTCIGQPARLPVVKFVLPGMLAAISHNIKAKLNVFVRAGSGLALAIVSGDQVFTPGCAQPLAAKLLLPSHPHGILFGKAAVRLAAT